MLAVLVNESRARRVRLSHDAYARHWVPVSWRPGVEALWRLFAREVYPCDDLVLSVRHRFFLRLIERKTRDGFSCVIVPCGLTSYPFLISECAAAAAPPFVECDLESVVRYKRKLAGGLIARGILPPRQVVWRGVDLSKVCGAAASIEDVSAGAPLLVVLEGISYYLPRRVWLRLIGRLRRSLPRGSVIAFDYWPDEERFKPVYPAFLRFCRRNGAPRQAPFAFYARKELQRLGAATAGSAASLERRVIGTRRLGGRRILRDTYATIEC
jgi:O-methyltransferase involved in polyketide biosynthesis